MSVVFYCCGGGSILIVVRKFASFLWGVIKNKCLLLLHPCRGSNDRFISGKLLPHQIILLTIANYVRNWRIVEGAFRRDGSEFFRPESTVFRFVLWQIIFLKDFGEVGK